MTTAQHPDRGQRALDTIDRVGVRTGFAWGFAEATLFFLLPDIAVGAVGLAGLKRALHAAAATIAGAAAGGVALYFAARWTGPGIRGVLDAIPAIPSEFFDRARDDTAASGGAAIVHGPTQGIPYKVYVAEWALAGRDVLGLVLWTIPARAARIVPVSVIAWLAGRLWRRVLGHRRNGVLLLVYVAVWVIIYVAYFTAVGL